ncbi:hypothetical protein TSTA_109710 [Talaromyces stipitatus ATCC 10500]|uniref:Reverse transcriptase Ty1/copia-type domain-containing protein n=1 Tax=Talaromyces stipitatus (strain ATCC 10500 / CBS 375.48 / QM 6759 / NRRL 1006) TaxID=441959 RepID=B8MUF2_TALSN|nr:uncharacterized protein TSTA_109710 [Talaromyces stipitatus ATCC 10500]EED11791.1 hypothetical protein TSTA_109710 [Talaromyces stipitatus ATCC 10500]
MYAAVSTQPDVAFAILRLARFLSNRGPKHHEAAKKVLCYLKRHLSKDASFADNTLDRKSSQAYIMTLYGATIGWQANKQDMVTTLTTEGECVLRLLLELGIQFKTPALHVFCNNKQMLELLEKDAPLLCTMFRYVDIHNHWVRQEV